MKPATCWGCGEIAPGGVCMGPHPNFDLYQAVQDGDFEPGSQLGCYRADMEELRSCPECGAGPFTRKGVSSHTSQRHWRSITRRAS